MASSKQFTDEEISYLLSLPAVRSVSGTRIEYSERFKRECMRRYTNGESPSKVFREAGLDMSLIGYKRIERCIARWSRTERLCDDNDPELQHALSASLAVSEGNRGGSSDEPTMFPNRAHHPNDIRDMLIAQQTKRINELESKVKALQAQLERRELAA